MKIDEQSYQFLERVAIKIDSHIPEEEAIRQTREEFSRAITKIAIKAAKRKEEDAQGQLALGPNPRRP